MSEKTETVEYHVERRQRGLTVDVWVSVGGADSLVGAEEYASYRRSFLPGGFDYRIVRVTTKREVLP